MLKELSEYDALYKLFQDKNCFKAYLSNYDDGDMDDIVHTLVSGVDLIHDSEIGAFISVSGRRYLYCWIEVPDKYMPYKNNEFSGIKCGDILRQDKKEGLVTAIELDKSGIYLTQVHSCWFSNKELFEKFTTADGMPIGKLNSISNKSIDMVYVEGGTFQMGSNSEEGNREKPIHSVTLSSFHIGKYEITQKQWTELMGSNPSRFKGDNLPVESISWYQAVEFCNKLSQKEGLTPAYTINGRNVTCNWDANGYRLPTEAEWEFAARGGNKSKGFVYAGSDNIDEVAWYESNSGSKTQAVGTKKANELGIYDMSGNVWEWCWDWYGSYQSSANNPTGASGTKRVLRGGSWSYDARYCRGAFRRSYCPDNGGYNYGFRVARNG